MLDDQADDEDVDWLDISFSKLAFKVSNLNALSVSNIFNQSLLYLSLPIRAPPVIG